MQRALPSPRNSLLQDTHEVSSSSRHDHLVSRSCSSNCCESTDFKPRSKARLRDRLSLGFDDDEEEGEGSVQITCDHKVHVVRRTFIDEQVSAGALVRSGKPPQQGGIALEDYRQERARYSEYSV